MTTGEGDDQQKPISCIPTWVLEDLKNCLKNSTTRKCRSQSISGQSRSNCTTPLQQRRRLRSEERWCGRPLRVALVGAEQVGKSSLAVRYLTKRFIGEYQSDSDMLYRSVLPVAGSSQNVELLDCSGQELKEEVLEWAEAFIVVYSITDKSSLVFAKTTVHSLSCKRPDALVMTCGNKSDLGHQRQVTVTQGRLVAQSHNAKYDEVSAAEDSDSVSAAFSSFLKDVKASRSKASPRYRKLSPRKLISSIVCRYNVVQPSTQLIVLGKNEQSKLNGKPSHL